MDKLTPQNAQQEHMVQILLAKMQGVEVEIYERFSEKWRASDSKCVYVDSIYRIKSHELPITREMWAMIDKEWKLAAKDSDGKVSFYKEEPLIIGRYWCPISDDHALNVLTLNTDGIDWRKSLTRRPEGV